MNKYPVTPTLAEIAGKIMGIAMAASVLGKTKKMEMEVRDLARQWLALGGNPDTVKSVAGLEAVA